MAVARAELHLSLRDKLKSGLDGARQRVNQSLAGMQTRLNKFKVSFATAFRGGGTALAGAFTNAFNQIPFANLLFNPIALLAAGAYKLNSYLQQSVQGYKSTAQEENKLAQIMKNTMGATKAQTEQVKNLFLEQQKIGVIDGTTQTAGAQELSTYLTKKESLKKLIPVMNDMLAQQYGLNASSEQAINIGSMLGKVMDGQTGALSRYGYKFDEAQEKILKTGTEAQRAAILFDVVNHSVGGVNKALAETPEGKLLRAANQAAGVKDRIGGLVVYFQTAFSELAGNTTSLLNRIVTKFETHKEEIFNLFKNLTSAITKVIRGLVSVLKPIVRFFVSWYRAIKSGNPLIQALTAVLGAFITGLVAYQLAVNGVVLVTKLWAAAQALLNIAMTANPIGLIIAGIVALTTLVVVAIKKWDQWGAAIMLFLGPIGMLISAVKSLYDHWESIKTVFRTDGIIGGLKRIGIVLLDALLKPVQQLLEMLAKIPGMAKLGNWSNDIKDLRMRLELIKPSSDTDLIEKKTDNLLEADHSQGAFSSMADDAKIIKEGGQAKNITVNFDSFIKNFSSQHQSMQKMDKNQLERFFTDMFMRMIRSVEMMP